MKTRLVTIAPFVSAAFVSLAACGSPSVTDDTAKSENEFSSPNSTLVTFEFDGQLDTDSTFGTGRNEIQSQMLYTIGHLNWDRSVGRLDNLVVTNIVKTSVGGKTHITYHAKLPVAWGSKTTIPSTYAFTLPTDVSFSGQESFTTKYMGACVDFGAHEVSSDNMWYYYRPKTSGCSITPADVVTVTATVTRSTQNTTGMYPEYQKVWEDNQLNVVAIFGKYEDGKTTADDAGIAGYNAFVTAARRELASLSLTTIPATIPSGPGVDATDVEFDGVLPNGFKVKINALLVDNIGNTTSQFDSRYAQLSERADIIAYNGHAGLGQNVRALARKGRWAAGQYVMLFMNGCDTFAYVDGSLAQTRSAVNPSDPSGTKFMEFVTNAMPSFFNSMPNASMSLVRGLMGYQTPKTYDQIFANVDRSEMVLVTGEEDNVFRPGMPIGNGGGGGGTTRVLDKHSSVAAKQSQSFATATVAAGTYKVTLADDGSPSADADLYVQTGTAPTLTSYACRPYLNGSNETCTVTLASDSTVNVLVNGYSGTAKFALTIDKQ